MNKCQKDIVRHDVKSDYVTIKIQINYIQSITVSVINKSIL
jgi:hypothetical protein